MRSRRSLISHSCFANSIHISLLQEQQHILCRSDLYFRHSSDTDTFDRILSQFNVFTLWRNQISYCFIVDLKKADLYLETLVSLFLLLLYQVEYFSHGMIHYASARLVTYHGMGLSSTSGSIC